MPLKPSERARLLKAANRPANRRPATKYNAMFTTDPLKMEESDCHVSDSKKKDVQIMELLCELRNMINWSDQYLRKSCHAAYLTTAISSARETAGKYKPAPKKS